MDLWNRIKAAPGWAFWVFFLPVLAFRCWSWLGIEDRCDFDCYMWFGHQVLAGERNYAKLECPHGMFYYPSANIWVYSLIANTCEWSFLCVQFAGAGAMFVTYVMAAKTLINYTSIPRWVVFLCYAVLSHNVPYLIIGKVTNDAYALLAIVLFVYFLASDRHWAASFCYSLSVGLKMNNLFYGPPLLVWYLTRLPFKKVFVQFAFMGMIQLVPALPFLWSSPVEYVVTAFNFSRTFTWQNSYAWKFLGQEIGQSGGFATILLLGTVLGLVALFTLIYPLLQAAAKEMVAAERLREVGSSGKEHKPPRGAAETSGRHPQWHAEIPIVLAILSNFVGYAFSRGLHVQFVLWVSWTLPLLWHLARLPGWAVCLLFFLYDEAYYTPLYDMLRMGRFDMNNSVFLAIVHFSTLALMFHHIIRRRLQHAQHFKGLAQDARLGPVGVSVPDSPITHQHQSPQYSTPVAAGVTAPSPNHVMAVRTTQVAGGPTDVRYRSSPVGGR